MLLMTIKYLITKSAYSLQNKIKLLHTFDRIMCRERLDNFYLPFSKTELN